MVIDLEGFTKLLSLCFNKISLGWAFVNKDLNMPPQIFLIAHVELPKKIEKGYISLVKALIRKKRSHDTENHCCYFISLVFAKSTFRKSM